MAEDNDDRARLTDVLGALVSGVAHARSVADAEVMGIASMYRRHEYLRNLSVPRLRVSKVAIELPLLLEGVIPGQQATANSPEHIADHARKALGDEAEDLVKYIDTTEHKMTPEVADRARALLSALSQRGFLDEFRKAMVNRMRRFRQNLSKMAPGRISLSDVLLRDEVGHATERLLRDMIAEVIARQAKRKFEDEQAAADEGVGAVAFAEDFEPTSKWTRAQEEQVINETMFADAVTELIDHVRTAAEDAAVFRATQPADFYVRVSTEEIKNAGVPGAVTRIRLTLAEEGLEWSSEQTEDGNATWKLIPE